MLVPNFEVKTRSFKAGYYTLEDFNGLATYWLVYENVRKNAAAINNSRLMLTLFNQLPQNSTINAHKKN